MIREKEWGSLGEKAVRLFSLINSRGCSVELTNFGAGIVSINVPDKNGNLANVILSYPDLEGYIADTCYLGATVGRFANRIANASFVLDGKKYLLEKNDGRNTNHGGFNGFNKSVFDAETSADRVIFSLTSRDGDGGYPGNLHLEVEYSWDDQNELLIRYTADTDLPTIANFTNHTYFNLSGGITNIFSDILSIRSVNILEPGKEYLPTGKIIPAGGLLFQGNAINEKISRDGERLFGLNIFYIFDEHKESDDPVCILFDPSSARTLQVCTSYPGMMLYTGDFLVSAHTGKILYPFDGLCLECQYFPDSPSHCNFPSTVLRPEKTYNEFIKFRFGLK